MIKSFKSEDCSFEDYLQKISTELAERELGKIVNVSSAENKVKITFNQLGKSEVVYELNKKNNGFECVHQSEKLAITHRAPALRNKIESKFSDVLKKLGATVEQG